MERQVGQWPRRADRIDVILLLFVDVGDRSAELGQVSRSHAVLTFEHLDAQSESDPVSDVEPITLHYIEIFNVD